FAFLGSAVRYIMPCAWIGSSFARLRFNMSRENSIGGTAVPRLSIARFRFEIDVRDPLAFDSFPGFVWRSLFGAVLRKTVCMTGLPQCQPCELLYSCAYPYLFETPPPYGSEKMRLYNATVHPYVIEPDENGANFPSGARIGLGFTLFGRGVAHLPLVVKVFH